MLKFVFSYVISSYSSMFKFVFSTKKNNLESKLKYTYCIRFFEGILEKILCYSLRYINLFTNILYTSRSVKIVYLIPVNTRSVYLTN